VIDHLSLIIVLRRRKMVRVGGLTAKYYKETRGVKVSGGQQIKSGTMLTRQGDKWKAGLNVTGRTHLTATCNGEVYFTRKKGTSNKVVTYINVRSAETPKK
jgi:ribosomal protein L27